MVAKIRWWCLFLCCLHRLVRGKDCVVGERAGCFVDHGKARLFPTQATGRNDRHMTRKLCAVLCHAKLRATDFRIGLEDGGQCWCAINLPSGAQKAADSNCQSACTGNATHTCGGRWRMEVFVVTGTSIKLCCRSANAQNPFLLYSNAPKSRLVLCRLQHAIAPGTASACACAPAFSSPVSPAAMCACEATGALPARQERNQATAHRLHHRRRPR